MIRPLLRFAGKGRAKLCLDLIATAYCLIMASVRMWRA